MIEHSHSYRITIIYVSLLGVIFGTIPIFGVGFQTSPTFNDPAGDPAFGMGEDILNAWIDDNQTHLMVKIQFAGAFTFEDFDILYILLSVNDSWGITDLLGHTFNFTVDYYLLLNPQSGYFSLFFRDTINTTNNLNNVENTNLGYFINDSTTKTVEIGYRINAYSGGAGFLAIVPGQNIKIQLKTSTTTDLAPNYLPYIYNMKQKSPAENYIGVITTVFLLIEYVGFGMLALSFVYHEVIKTMRSKRRSSAP